MPTAWIGQSSSSAACGPAAERRCRLWAQTFAPLGYAHASCAGDPLHVFCGMGDTCVDGDVPERPRCDCGGVECAVNEVCISDTLDGVPRCVEACLPPL